VAIGGIAKSLKFLASIQGNEVPVLVDSGSFHSFINVKLLMLLSGVSNLSQPVIVQIANGQVVHCTQGFHQSVWSIQGVQFVSNLKVLPLPYYDLILGMDWLKSHNPMHVDWSNKWMTVNVAGQLVQLHGLQPSLPTHYVVELCVVTSNTIADLFSCMAQQDIPAPIQQLLLCFDQVFQEPQGLPPSRACDHNIPLVPGAQPVNVRPYRFSPAMKDEIETQVKEMLNKCLIQHSRSSFSSLVLLVKKKDNTWRFCVDYRHINALTVKFMYPTLIIDELLDELHGASWFPAWTSWQDFIKFCYNLVKNSRLHSKPTLDILSFK
jgi:hypothetical protein